MSKLPLLTHVTGPLVDVSGVEFDRVGHFSLSKVVLYGVAYFNDGR
jgi:hypothetical protein